MSDAIDLPFIVRLQQTPQGMDEKSAHQLLGESPLLAKQFIPQISFVLEQDAIGEASRGGWSALSVATRRANVSGRVPTANGNSPSRLFVHVRGCVFYAPARLRVAWVIEFACEHVRACARVRVRVRVRARVL
ncbi:MAG: hypothetical protein ACO3OK_08275, partial [Limisphaerales bacterium]